MTRDLLKGMPFSQKYTYFGALPLRLDFNGLDKLSANLASLIAKTLWEVITLWLL